jgi:LysM repeat protein
MMMKVLSVSGWVFALTVGFLFISSERASQSQSAATDSLKATRAAERIDKKFSATELPTFSYSNFPPDSAIDFCGEALPLKDPEVFERFEREFVYNINDRAQMIMYLKRAGRFFPYIESRLKADTLPDDLKYLAVAESRLLDLRSPAGAAGFWQLMPAVAQSYGLVVNASIDERYNLEKATDGAIKYLKSAYKKFGNWTMTAASYNMGVYGAADEQEFQSMKNYYDLWLNRETARYLFRIVAIKEIMSKPKKYGFADVVPLAPIDTKTIDVKKDIENLALWARQQGTTFKAVKLLNPWIRGRSLPAPVSASRPYKVLVPKFTESDSVAVGTYQYKIDKAKLNAEKQGIYIVREGDTLESIANQCGLEISELRQLNKIKDGETIQVGQQLRISP